MTIVSDRTFYVALERGFTTLQPIKLVRCKAVRVNLTPVSGSRIRLWTHSSFLPVRPPYPHGLAHGVATSFKQWLVERTTKQLYTYFMESNIVFRIAIVHATDFKITIDTANIMTALGKYCLLTQWEYKRSISSRKCLKNYKRCRFI